AEAWGWYETTEIRQPGFWRNEHHVTRHETQILTEVLVVQHAVQIHFVHFHPVLRDAPEQQHLRFLRLLIEAAGDLNGLNDGCLASQLVLAGFHNLTADDEVRFLEIFEFHGDRGTP